MNGSDWYYEAVCVGAHPDDVEIGMGATIAKLTAAGAQVAIVDLTDGEPTPYGSPEIRAGESAKAAEILGAERRTLTQANRYLFDSVEARTELATVLRELRPRMLFVPYPVDAHPDHVAAASICLGARFYAKFTKTDMPGEPFYPPRVFRYMAVHQRIIAEPSFVIDVTAELPVKLEALRAYESQFAANPANAGIVESMEAAAAMWGALARVPFGEPFFALEPVALGSLDVVL
ncbi:MAG: PIG-L family deacetylase [Coriobacteriia bacterium]|nr:PIG-L family deacetylase [Coriobacteriia bacterium]